MARREALNAEKDQHAAERREQLEQWQSRLAEQVTDLVNGDQWQRWLEVASRFHRYSFRNSVMILIQCEDATAVAGYQAWKTLFGRQVNRGETGIRILAPVTKRFDTMLPVSKEILAESTSAGSWTLARATRQQSVPSNNGVRPSSPAAYTFVLTDDCAGPKGSTLNSHV